MSPFYNCTKYWIQQQPAFVITNRIPIGERWATGIDSHSAYVRLRDTAAMILINILMHTVGYTRAEFEYSLQALCSTSLFRLLQFVTLSITHVHEHVYTESE